MKLATKKKIRTTGTVLVMVALVAAVVKIRDLVVAVAALALISNI